MNTAFVNIWGQRAGAVSWDAGQRVASFEYEPAFAANGWDLSPLKMPLEQKGMIFSFPELRNTSTFKGLPGMLADILPDKYGNALINTWLARQGRPPDSMNPVEMLCFIGSRGMGALEFQPSSPSDGNIAAKIEIDDLINVARDILSNRMSVTGNIEADRQKALTEILKIGTSAGGARAKALIAYNEQTKEVRSGQTTAPKGFKHWLIKFDGVHDSQFGETYGYGRVEMAYYLMALDCGIEMMESRLLEEKDRAHFMTLRFDRDPEKGKTHVQTWCAMDHVDFMQVGVYGYEDLFQTMRALGLPYPQAEQLYRRMVFNVLARNCDDHTKNFAFMMGSEGDWKLAPAYDICHAYRPGSIWVSKQSISINGKRDAISMDDLMEVARKMNIRKAGQLIAEIQHIVGSWTRYAEKTGVDKGLKTAIKETLLKL